MSESKDFYNIGVRYFNNGDLEKAIANLDLAISHDMKNSAALNLRGLIYYIKGQANKALSSWELNVKFNDNQIAKKHIEAFEEDKVHLYRYNNAVKVIKEGKIHVAIELLEKAADSDFNVLNVRNALAYCYIKEARYQEAKNCIEIVLEKDKNNKSAKENIEILKKKSGMSVGTKFNKKVYIGVACLVLVILAAGSSLTHNFKKAPSKTDNLASIAITETKEDKTENTQAQEKEEVQEVQTTETEKVESSKESNTLNAKALKDAVDSKDFVLIAKTLKDSNLEGLSELELDVVNDAKELIKTDGIREIYKSGTSEFNAGNFGKAKDKFLMALDYSKDTYLDSHITYMLSATFEKLKDEDNAIKYYSKYEKTDYGKEGSYREVVLYKLAILNKDKNKEESKKFARKLVNEYSDSMYNNDNIKAILN